MIVHPFILILFAIGLAASVLRLGGWLPGGWEPGEFVMIAFMWGVTNGAFHYEAWRALRLIRALVNEDSNAPTESLAA